MPHKQQQRPSPRTRQQQQHGGVVVMTNNNLGYLLVGALLGWLASSSVSLLVATTTASDDENNDELRSNGGGGSSSGFWVRQSPRKRARNLSSQSFNGAADVKNADDGGWKLIHVYVGGSSSSNNNAAQEEQHRAAQMAQASTINSDYFYSSSSAQRPRSWFSQLRQDEVVAHLFRHKRSGYFVDLAANDAVRISNTYALETRYHWTGIAIEPNAVYWPGLALRRCHVAAAVVGRSTGERLRFKFPRRAAPQGGLVGREFDNREPGKSPEEDQMRYTVTLQDIFERFQTPPVIDYLSLDVEGAELFIMESFPFDRYRINALTVERADNKLSALLQTNGYVQLKVLKHWGESLWIHSSVQDSLDTKAAMEIDTEHYKYRERVVT